MGGSDSQQRMEFLVLSWKCREIPGLIVFRNNKLCDVLTSEEFTHNRLSNPKVLLWIICMLQYLYKYCLMFAVSRTRDVLKKARTNLEVRKNHCVAPPLA